MTSPSLTSKALIRIPGASQSLGFAVAQPLLHSGNYHILVSARNESNTLAAVNQLQSVDAVDKNLVVDKTLLTPMVLDVTDDTSINSAALRGRPEFGYLDVLVNNAGISQVSEDLPIREQYRKIFDVNVFGVAAVTESFLPLLQTKTPDGGRD
jgi:NAD(P)-dependent dehydrogenase (short-subunit alcohol dehydrogenase family)